LRDKFGELYEISEPEWKDEVTNQQNTFVIVFLHKVGVPSCDVLEARLRPVVAKYRSTKFVKIRSESVRLLATQLAWLSHTQQNSFVAIRRFHTQ
jgi:hypothetical protein